MYKEDETNVYFLCDWICADTAGALPDGGLPGKMISTALAEAIALFLKGAEMALRLYRSWVEKKE